MASRDTREKEFPATSLSRTTGHRLQPTQPSSTPLESHPLGFPPSDAATLHHHPQQQQGQQQTKYRPYTPRQRVVLPTASVTTTTAASASTSTSTSSAPGQHGTYPPSVSGNGNGGDATTKLQMTSAKDKAQSVGLDSASIGWAMMEKVVAESETGELWADIWSAITAATAGGSKATLLLPTEPISGVDDKLTPEFLKDHIVLLDESVRKDGRPIPAITLSGLRGTLHRNDTTFYSTLSPSSRLFSDLIDAKTRSSAFRALPPLPHPATSPSSFAVAYPSVRATTTSTVVLPLPPRALTSAKPPLPPRPGSLRSTHAHSAPGPSTLSTSTSAPISTSSSSSSTRIPNPFASLFGHRPSTPTPTPPTATPLPTPLPASASTNSPSSSIRSLDPTDSSSSHHHPTIEISAIIVDKKVVRRDVGRQMNRALRNDIRSALSVVDNRASGGGGEKEGEERVGGGRRMPPWVVQRVLEICEVWFPFVRATRVMSTGNQSTTASNNNVKEEGKEKEWIVNTSEETPDEIAEWLNEEFYALLEEDLRVELGVKRGGGRGGGDTQDTDRESGEEGGEEGSGGEGQVEVELRIYEIMETVERVVCSAFYDRLFMQPSTDDTAHDEALANRVAALNILDLTLEHLDIRVPPREEDKREVDRIVRACGAKLCELDMIRAPRDKARILVDAHQIVVDGLSRVPPIRLMSPEESKALREQQQQAGNAEAQPQPTIGVVPPPSAAQHEHEHEQKQQQQQMELSPLSLEGTAVLPPSPQPHPSNTLPSPSPSPSPSPAPPPPQQSQQQQQQQQERPSTPTPVSSDVLLPMIIFSVAKSNPTRLVSNLRYTQRFRSRSHASRIRTTGHGGGDTQKEEKEEERERERVLERVQVRAGEEAFCLINVLAVAEFLENVDLEGLGLGGGAGTSGVSTVELTPIIPRTTTFSSPTTPTSNTTTVPQLTPTKPGSGSGVPLDATTNNASLRGKVEQQVDAIAGSANKVISGVVDSSFGILRSLLPITGGGGSTQQQQARDAIVAGVSRDISLVPAPGADTIGSGTSVGAAQPSSSNPRTGLGQIMMRRDTGGGFSTLASIAASLPIPSRSMSGAAKGGEGEESGQQLVAVSRSESVRSGRSGRGSLRGSVSVVVGSESESEDEDESDEGDGTTNDDEDEQDNEEDEEQSESEDSDENGEEERKGVDIPGISVATEGVAASTTSSFAADARSIRSFESMLSESKKRDRERKQKQKQKKARSKAREMLGGGKNVSVSVMKALSEPRKSLSDRLASVSALAGGLKGSPPDSRRSSLLQPPIAAAQPVPSSGSPTSSRAPSPSPSASASRPTSPLLLPRVPSPSPSPFLPLPPARASRLPVPNRRFMECEVDELRLSEVAELLREYRRLVEGVRALGGFEA